VTLPVPFRAAVLGEVAHGFFGRQGGGSAGIHAGLNVGLGSADDETVVRANRDAAVAAVAPGACLLTPYQIHSATCVTVDAPFAERPQADALVTDRAGLAIGVVTADCAPVLLADAAAGVVGAAHAGWKGALAGVTDAAVAAMVARMYVGLDARLLGAASRSVLAHLLDLARRGLVVEEGDLWRSI